MTVSAAHLTHDEIASPRDLYDDARAAGKNLRALDRAAHAIHRDPPSIRYDDYPREVTKREIRVSEAAVRLANALHLHLD